MSTFKGFSIETKALLQFIEATEDLESAIESLADYIEEKEPENEILLSVLDSLIKLKIKYKLSARSQNLLPPLDIGRIAEDLRGDF